MQTIIVLLLAIGAGVLTYIFEGPWWIYAIAVGVVIIYAYLFIYLFPKISGCVGVMKYANQKLNYNMVYLS